MTNQQANLDRSKAARQKVAASLAKRYRSEKRFVFFGRLSIALGVLALLVLFIKIISEGSGAFTQTYLKVPVTFDLETLEVSEADFADDAALQQGNFQGLIRQALRDRFPDVSGRKNKRELYRLVSVGAEYELYDLLREDRELLGQTKELWLLADDDIDTYIKSADADNAYAARMSEQQISWLESLRANDQLERKFNSNLFLNGDSSEPETAGIAGAVLGSLLTLMVTLALSFPIGVAAAVYLEEYAPKNRLTDFIEVNINNLAAVPSVIFGLLGLAIFLNLFGMPRSVPLVGGLVLTLMTLPTIIISSRSCLKAVPPSIREAALGMGASKMQMILHHVLPLAMPGMLTGAIIGMAQALGETAPLLMIGMVAFIADIPGSVTDPATVLPVQIYLWADSPERAFTERTSAAIMVLLAFLILMNTLAVLLRKKLERRW